MDIVVHKNPSLSLLANQKPNSAYKAMYSTLWDGIVLDPAFMLIPIDDHIVHRGDGVFEAFRSHHRAIYDMKAHLDRLLVSAAGIQLPLPKSSEEIENICKALGRAAQLDSGTFRLYVSRGPGGFTSNPYESMGSQLYVVLTESGSYPASQYENGVSVALSQFQSKTPPFCKIKNCNYLQNVLMKKEALDSGADYTVCLDPKGHVTESSTENIALLSKSGEFLSPLFEHMLKGTTLLRCLDLAEKNKKTLGLSHVGQKNLTPEDFENAQEVMMIGTTMGVLPVKSFENKMLPTPSAASISKQLLVLLKEDIMRNQERRSLY